MRLKLVFIVMLVTTLGFGLWPLRIDVENQVLWNAAKGAFEFGGSSVADYDGYGGLLISSGEIDGERWDEISFVIELKGPSSENGLGMILEVFDEASAEHSAVKIAQWKNHLAIRSGRLREQVGRGYSEIGYRNCISDTGFSKILVSSNSLGTTISSDRGEPVFSKGFRLLDPRRPFRGRLIVGNDPEGEEPFLGSIRRLEVYNRTLRWDELADVAPSESIVRLAADSSQLEPGSMGFRAPERLSALKRVFFEPATFRSWNKPVLRRDAILNLLGFVPLGVCICLLFGGTGGARLPMLLVKVVGSCLLVSLAIECSQGFLLGRYSSQLDLLLNGFGGGLSVALVRYSPKRFWAWSKR